MVRLINLKRWSSISLFIFSRSKGQKQKQKQEKGSAPTCRVLKLTQPTFLSHSMMFSTFIEQMTFQHTRGSYPPSLAFMPVSLAKKKKRVTMNSTVSVYEFTANPMTKEEKSKLYYTKDDYNMTILQVKAIALTHQPQLSDKRNSNSYLVAAEADGFLRGIESHLYPQRSQNRFVARRALIKYQTYLQTHHNGIAPDQKAKALRTASEKLSAWSQLVAQETARLDSIRAYDADYLIPLEGSPMEFSSYSEFTLKRRESVQEDVNRAIPNGSSRPSKKVRA